MLLTITTTHRPARDLSYLLHKHPDHVHERDLGFGTAYVFFPVASDDRCTAALLLDVDAVGLIRDRPKGSGNQAFAPGYVSDRAYAASSFLSVAIARSFSTAIGGRSKERQDLADTAIPIEAVISPVPCAQGPSLLHQLFEPLGYQVAVETAPLNPRFPAWGESAMHRVTLRATKRLAELLTHLYVLIPVLDNDKHYWVGDDEVEKLLRKGEGWLGTHPARDLIARRYLKHRRRLADLAIERLTDDDAAEAAEADAQKKEGEAAIERPIRLNDLRLAAVLGWLKESGAKSVLDLGCGEGRLLNALLRERQFARVVGADASTRSLQYASERLRLDEMAPRQRERIDLWQTAVTYRDRRFENFDAITLIEVIEHLDEDRLTALVRSVFEFARPGSVVVTTPNREYNALFPGLEPGKFRHADHRFEWTRSEFSTWCQATCEKHGYQVRVEPIGALDERLGAPTQAGVFMRCS
jgi:3' terminal RNA ribose 2'-O-methyltransferase Hen1